MSADTATVQSLTAEVRVLMVGNRQVTLSVARQLDEFPYAAKPLVQFIPFGRIRTGAKGTVERLNPKWDGWGGVVGSSHQSQYVDVPAELAFEFVGSHNGTLVRLAMTADDQHVLTKNELDILHRWQANLPLIVLAGLR